MADTRSAAGSSLANRLSETAVTASRAAERNGPKGGYRQLLSLFTRGEVRPAKVTA